MIIVECDRCKKHIPSYMSESYASVEIKDPDSYTDRYHLCPDCLSQIRESITGKTRMVFVPKKYGRLIDADALRSRVKTECNQYGAPTIGYEDGAKILDMIDNAPTIIEAEGGGDHAEEV